MTLPEGFAATRTYDAGEFVLARSQQRVEVFHMHPDGSSNLCLRMGGWVKCTACSKDGRPVLDEAG